nr:PREDICTED: uncharacterized protein LOC105272871 [Fopius arisanus]
MRDNVEQIETYSDYMVDFIGKLDKIQEIAYKQSQKSKLNSKRLYDRDYKSLQLRVDQFAYVRKEPKMGKLDQAYTDPYEIIDITEKGNGMACQRTDNNEKITTVYVDGSCSNNGHPGAIAGLGIWFGENHPLNTYKTLTGKRVTNIAAETAAAIEACRICLRHDIRRVRIVTDSKYLVDCMTTYLPKWKENRWLSARTKPVINQRLLRFLDEISSQLESIKKAEEKLEELVRSPNMVISNINTMEYLQHLTQIAVEVEYAAKKYIETGHRLVQAIEEAKHGKLHPTLINSEQVKAAAHEFEKVTKNSIFPVSRGKIDNNLLMQVSSVSTGFSNGNFIITLNIPLLTRDYMDLYKMIPCKTLQTVHGNQTVVAYVQLEKEFIIISNDLTTQWTKLNSSDGWLYSAVHPEKVEISCEDLATAQLIVNGTGLLHIRSTCTAETTTTILEKTGLIQAQLPSIYNLPINMNISEIAPVLINPPRKLHPLTNIDLQVMPLPDDSSVFDESMQRTINEARNIGLHHQEEYYHRILTTTNCTVTGLLSLVSVVEGVWAYKKGFGCLSFLSCCSKGKKGRTSRKSVVSWITKPDTEEAYELPTFKPRPSILRVPAVEPPPPPTPKGNRMRTANLETAMESRQPTQTAVKIDYI